MKCELNQWLCQQFEFKFLLSSALSYIQSKSYMEVKVYLCGVSLKLWVEKFVILNAGTVFAYGVTSSGKTHTMHVSAMF